MKIDKIVAVDLIRKKEEHYVFNKLTLNALASITKEIDFYLSDDSALLDEFRGNISVHKMKVVRTKFYFWIKSTLNTAKILIKNRHYKKKIIFLSATPLHYLFLSLSSLLLRCDLYVFMHGELGYLKNDIGFGQKLGAKFINMAFKFGRVNFICINAPIYDILSEMYPNRVFLHVEHPIQNISEKNSKEGSFLTFGTFGIQSKDKGSENIYELAIFLENKQAHAIPLITVGVSDGSFEYDQHPVVKHYCKGSLSHSLIPRSVFFENIKRIDVVLLFNSNLGNLQKYDLVSSGVFADCIAFSMPIIALRNKKLESYFKLYGEFGILCDSLTEMASAIQYINNNQELLTKYRDVLRQVQKNMRPEGYAKIIREKLFHEKS